MAVEERWPLTKEIQEKLIEELTDNLPLLRAKLDITQEELANLIGTSRQTLNAIESRKRPMMWQTYVALIYFFEKNLHGTSLLKHLECYPDAMVYDPENKDADAADKESGAKEEATIDIIKMLVKLDAQALQSLQTMAMVEYARCTKTPGEIVVKAFDGLEFKQSLFEENTELKKALSRLKKGK